MAITLVQTVAATSGPGNISATLTATTVGSLIVVGATGGGNEASNFVSSITGGGNTFTKIGLSNQASGSEIWYGISAISFTSITVNFTGTPFTHLAYIREYTGLETTNVVDISIFGGNSGTAMSTVKSASNLVPNELVVVVGVQGNAASVFTAGSGFGNLVTQNNGVSLGMEDAILTSVASQTGTMTSTVNTTNDVSMVSFIALGSHRPFPNNYQQLKVGDGMSTTEKLR